MKFCCGITLFNPKDEYIDRIKELIEEFELIIIYDNSKEMSNNLKELITNSKILYEYNGENEGLATAYNYFLSNSKNFYDYLCILDQDSIFTVPNIRNMKFFLTQVNKNPNVAISAPIYSNMDLNSNSKNKTITKVNWVINSGSFLNLKLMLKYDIQYDSNYFIDRLDADFCKIIKKLNLDIVVYKDSILEQELGYTYKNHSAHSDIRHYYIFRDRLYYNNKHNKKLKFIILSLLQSTKHLLKILFYEDKKILKFKACFQGLVDYNKKNSGKNYNIT